jgi:hypothetical protein
MLHEEAGYTTASDLSHGHDLVFSLIAGRSPYTPVRRHPRSPTVCGLTVCVARYGVLCSRASARGTISAGSVTNSSGSKSALPADRAPDMAKVAAIFKRYDIEILAVGDCEARSDNGILRKPGLAAQP